MNYWLFKTEPSTYSWEDLKKQPNRTDYWDGVRNYQARNFLRDQIKQGDGVLFYHSVKNPQVIMGIAKVVREAYPDPTQFDPESRYFDPKSDPQNSRWFVVDIQAVAEFDPPITREQLKLIPELKDMVLLQKGSRLSIQPVREDEWNVILKLSKLIDLK